MRDAVEESLNAYYAQIDKNEVAFYEWENSVNDDVNTINDLMDSFKLLRLNRHAVVNGKETLETLMESIMGLAEEIPRSNIYDADFSKDLKEKLTDICYYSFVEEFEEEFAQ